MTPKKKTKSGQENNNRGQLWSYYNNPQATAVCGLVYNDNSREGRGAIEKWSDSRYFLKFMLRGNAEWHITESSFKYDSKALDCSNGNNGDMKIALIEIRRLWKKSWALKNQVLSFRNVTFKIIIRSLN